MSQTDNVFAGSIPTLYDQYLGSLLFQPYARYLTEGRLLETAAGTGIVTRKLATGLSNKFQIVATDLNQPMIDHAASQLSSSRVAGQQADALKLPFEDASFDCIVCQFGIMFVPDKLKAYREALRVLKSGEASYSMFGIKSRRTSLPISSRIRWRLYFRKIPRCS